MATPDLKSILHQQIDRLEDPKDVQDLLLTVSEFISQRTTVFTETPELLAQLEQALSSAQTSHLTLHDQVATEAKQWITR
ncbi:hypothetical protein [Spirosoma linguale]|uniref:Uncharacterized protein n=1 Tax=Spirosoma linguale (strain ATCC 33905 / DSM 74 / LMG 10896 / Claus 1) TaxID=504472 RepID=D2QTB5_SPILD|nr:hypothetical protein Slin_6085 [Spirosoma linguale DSM 74]